MGLNLNMSTLNPYLSETEAPARVKVDAFEGMTLLEFCFDWCGHCRAEKARWEADTPKREKIEAAERLVQRKKARLTI